MTLPERVLYTKDAVYDNEEGDYIMKKIMYLLSAFLLLAGCNGGSAEPEDTPASDPVPETEPAADTEAADWSHMKALVDDGHMGVQLLGWVSGEEELYDLIGDLIGTPEYRFIGELAEADLIIGDMSEEYEQCVYLFVPNTDFDMTLYMNRYDQTEDESTEILYRGTFDHPLLLVNDNAFGDRTVSMRIIDETNNKGEFRFYPSCSLKDSRIVTDFYMGIVDITDYPELENVPFYAQSLFDRVYYLPEVQETVQKGGELHDLWEMPVDGHNHLVYGLFNDGDISGDNVIEYFAVRPDDPGVWRSEDLTTWDKAGG